MENDVLKDLMNVMTDDDTGQEAKGEEPAQVMDNEATQVLNENESDYKAMFEAYKNENDNKLNALMSELEALKNPKPREQDLQREQYLKELGLDGLDEKLKRLEELDKKQKDKEEQDALIAKYAQVESELRKAYPEMGSFLEDVLKADKDASISFLNMIKGQDEVFKNKTGLSGELDIKAWQKDNHAYENRINQEYGSAISKLDKLNNGNIVLNNEDLSKLENFKNNNFLEQDVKNNIQSYLDEIKEKEVSAEQIFSLRTAINKQLNTGNKTYNTKKAYGIIKEILDNTNKNFALKENFKESYLGMMKPQETKEGLADRLVKGLRNINEDKNLENAFKGMNEQERLANETHAMNALLEKHRIEGIGYDFKGLAKDMKDVEFSSKKLKDVKDVMNTYALIYNNNRDLIMTALTSSGKRQTLQ
ncbi:Uncharacterised protein [Campylobacter jejuni subsp. doylei]|nr:Uncharacterised protein [Campylobacter jejuni subsp. doylei]